MIKNEVKEDILIKYTTKLSAYFIIIAVLGFCILMLPFAFTQSDIPNYGIVGDTLGGLLNPIIAIPATLLTFLAFWVQYKANEQQKRDLQIERFENKFYAMLQIHRDNVNEVSIGLSLSGRKSFISMFNELKFTYYSIKDYHDSSYKNFDKKSDISDDVLFNIAYLIFFFGIGPNSSLIVIDMIDQKYKVFFLSAEIFMKEQQILWKEERKKGQKIAVNVPPSNVFELDVKYMPFNGQMSKLSHYVRHLFQLVKYVDDADDKIFSYEDKYNYIASIRAQLSSHEQLLLFYNAASVLGKPWLDEPNYLKKYCVIKSTPLPLASFYKNPKELLGEINEYGKIMFEWGEIKSRMTEL